MAAMARWLAQLSSLAVGFFFSSRRRHTRLVSDWSSDVCSSDLRPDSALAMSDVVVTCGVPVAPEGTVRLDPNPTRSVRPGEPLVAYFEGYHLAQGPGGQGRVQYQNSVRSAPRATRVWHQRLCHTRPAGMEL